jgi:hypothetical protein
MTQATLFDALARTAGPPTVPARALDDLLSTNPHDR